MRHLIDPNTKSRRVVEIVNRDRFKPLLYADLYIPSWVNGYSIGVEYMYNYFLSKFPKNFFKTIYVAGQSALNDFRKYNTGDLFKRENPACQIGSNIQYDFDDDKLDLNYYTADFYIKHSDYERSFFKDPSKKLYIGHSMETMLINYTIKTRYDTKSEQIDCFNRIRKLFPIGLSSTIDSNMDVYLPYELMTQVAKSAGFDIDTDNTIIDPVGFCSYLNKHSQLPILYKLMTNKGKYEFFVRMSNLPIHLDFRNPLDADDGEQSGQLMSNYSIEMQVAMRLPVPKFFAFYNEGYLHNDVEVQDPGVAQFRLYSIIVNDIPEENKYGWPKLGYFNYQADEDEDKVVTMDISQWFDDGTKETKVGYSLNDIIADAIKSGISPDSFIDVKVYQSSSREETKIKMDWIEKKAILKEDTDCRYFYVAIYVDREYMNSKIVQFTRANADRVSESPTYKERNDKLFREAYVEDHIIEK